LKKEKTIKRERYGHLAYTGTHSERNKCYKFNFPLNGVF